MESTDTQVLYNIDSNGQAINYLDKDNNNSGKGQYSKAEQKRLYGDQDDGVKVAAIAKKIKELT